MLTDFEFCLIRLDSLICNTVVKSEIWGSCSTSFEHYCFLGCDALFFGRWMPKFWRNLLLPSSGWKSSILKMKAAGSPELLIPIYQVTWCHTEEDSNLHWWEGLHIHPCVFFMPRSNVFTSKKYFIKLKKVYMKWNI
jgi:hypothetical protein